MDIFYPIAALSGFITNTIFSLPASSPVAKILDFFIYDSLKIIILLLFINFFMAAFRHYLSINKIKDILISRNWHGLDYFLAALFGVFTPFCSCSSIPLFIGFVSSGIPLGVTFAFLITSPIVNEASLALFPALFGLKFTLIYNLTGIAIGVLGGMLIQKLNMEKYIEPAFLGFKSQPVAINSKKENLRVLAGRWWSQGWGITKSLIPYILIGITIGAIIHGFVPSGFFEQYLSGSQWWSVPLAALVGVPFYANSVSVIPIMEALIDKGIPIGTILAFMTATVTLSIPEALILKKAMKLPLLITFFSITTLGIILLGYLFNTLY